MELIKNVPISRSNPYRNHTEATKYPIRIDICGDLYFHQLEVRENAWREFRSISRHKGLILRDSFKQAVIGFLEDRAEMLREIDY